MRFRLPTFSVGQDFIEPRRFCRQRRCRHGSVFAHRDASFHLPLCALAHEYRSRRLAECSNRPRVATTAGTQSSRRTRSAPHSRPRSAPGQSPECRRQHRQVRRFAGLDGLVYARIASVFCSGTQPPGCLPSSVCRVAAVLTQTQPAFPRPLRSLSHGIGLCCHLFRWCFADNGLVY